jgi:5-methylcytosine-specific restriction enzyme A
MLCAEAGCQARVSRGRCARHRRERDRRYLSRNRQLYNSKRWRLTRERKLSISPTCERCGETLAQEVHHRTSLADDDSDRNRWSLDGLVSVCKPCHSRETRREQIRR